MLITQDPLPAVQAAGFSVTIALSLPTLILEYLRVLLWPLLAFGFALIFRQDIRAFIDRIARVRFPLPKPAGETRAVLERQYAGVRQRFPRAYAHWSLDQYLHLLLSRNLIEGTGQGRYRLTEKGSSFLSSITSLRYPKEREW